MTQETPGRSTDTPPGANRPWRWRIALLPRGRRGWIRAGLIWGGLGLLTFAATAYMTCMPHSSYEGPLPPPSAAQRELADRLRGHVEMLASRIGERNFANYPKLCEAAAYIEGQFVSAGLPVTRHEYRIGQRPLWNLSAQITGTLQPQHVLVIGAHYDSVYDCPGANDNASGVAALLELASWAAKAPVPQRTLRFVAFPNEEPPYFNTDQMGSRVYARACRQAGDHIVAMMSLETLGCYSDAPGSQTYPFPFSLLYPDRGNFVGFVGNLESRPLVRACVAAFRNHAPFPSEGVAAPGWITGVGWSDHASFWEQGYPALMITDTAPFRYTAYHTPQDTPDNVDVERLARVVEGLQAVMLELSAPPS